MEPSSPLAQTDLKRLVAYTSISHLGFVLLGVFAANTLALQGALMTMICHGISTGALFIVVGALQQRMHTRAIDAMGGLWATVPRMSGVALFFALASLGLPGLGDFIGEFLVLLGTYQVNVAMAAVAAVGVLTATFLRAAVCAASVSRAQQPSWQLPDLMVREGLLLGVMVALLLWLGLYPQPVFRLFAHAVNQFPAIWR